MRWSWWICPWDNQVAIDDASVTGIDCSAISKNIYLIWWYGEEGEILYKDRFAIREPFTDFKPLIRYFDAFIRQAQKAKQPITLTQARFVKLRMIDALFVLRQAQDEQRLQHKNAIAKLATVDEIAAYDITQGW